jgi:EAL domain-containing protein (putative c-di-GMP-specific phosphodiesterase class I)
MTINVAEKQLEEPSVVRSLSEAMQQAGVLPSNIILEVNAGVLHTPSATVQVALAEARALGVRVAIDGFAWGIFTASLFEGSNLSMLKIAGSLTADVATNSVDHALIRAILAFAGDLHIDVVAEGVESEPLAQALRALGCELAQGFMLYEPMSFGMVQELIRYGSGAKQPDAHMGGSTNELVQAGSGPALLEA